MTASSASPNASRPEGASDLLRLLIDTVSDYAIIALDPSGIVLSWNPGGERLFGYAAADVIGRNFSLFYGADDIAGGRPERDLAITVADARFEEEAWRIRHDGGVFWASTELVALRGADRRLLGFGVVVRDLTERRSGEEVLRDSEERFRLLVNSVADYAIFLLDEHGHVSSWNRGAERLKGYRADEVLGRHFAAFYTVDDVRQELPAQLLRQALEQGHADHEGWRLRKDGSRFWASVTITALHGADGSHRGYAKVTKDLTERKRNEDALRGVLERERDATEKLRELDRMRADVMAVVAHDLRTPLDVVRNLVHLARREWSSLDDAAKLHQLERVGARIERMAQLVDDLFRVVRINAGQLRTEREPFDVVEVTREAIADAIPPGDRSRVVFEPPGEHVAWGDQHRTWEVIVNLLSNALKFSDPETPINVQVQRPGDDVAVVITDVGPGIPPDRQHLLFQQFSRLQIDAGGVGMGLFIAKTMVEAQGGRIGVDSTVGEGSTFWFTLPGTS